MKLLEIYEKSDDHVERYFSKVLDSKFKTFEEVFYKKKKKQIIRKVGATLLKNTWLNAAQGKYNKKAIDRIASIFVTNVAVLRANTDLSGHSAFHDPILDLFEFLDVQDETDLPYNTSEFPYSSLYEAFDEIYDYIGEISDYGTSKLEKLVMDLFNEENYSQRVLILDKMLNVIHETSDLAEIFIDGGTNTLNKIFDGNLFEKDDDDEN